MAKKNLGLKLLELRQKHHLTQKELCDALYIGRSTYSYFETGKRTPDIDTLLLIAEYYHVSIDSLISDDKYSAHTDMISSVSAASQTEKGDQLSSSISAEDLMYHIKSKHISPDDILALTKSDFNFLKRYHELSEENREELNYLINYKIRRQTSRYHENS